MIPLSEEKWLLFCFDEMLFLLHHHYLDCLDPVFPERHLLFCLNASPAAASLEALLQVILVLLVFGVASCLLRPLGQWIIDRSF